MRDLHKILIGPLAQVRLLLPGVILADHQYAYALLHQQVNNPVTHRVQVVIDTPVPLVRDALHALCCTFASQLAQ